MFQKKVGAFLGKQHGAVPYWKSHKANVGNVIETGF